MSYSEPRFALLRKTWKQSVIICAVLCLIYFIAVIITSIALYKYSLWNTWTANAAQIFPFPAALIDNEPLKLTEYRREVAARTYFNSYNNLKIPAKDIKEEVMKQLVTKELYEQSLFEANISLDPKLIDQKVTEVINSAGGEENVAKFLRENYGPTISIDNFRHWTERLLIESAIQNQLLTKATVRHILIAAPQKATSQQVADAKKRAESVKKKIDSPAKFDAIAKEFSEDVTSRGQGGLQGATSRGEIKKRFSEEYENALFTSEPGKVVGPVRSKYGWHIIIVDSRSGSIDKSLAEYTDQLLSSAKITTFVKY